MMHTEVPYNLQSSGQIHASLRAAHATNKLFIKLKKAQYLFIFVFSQHMASQEFQNLVSVLFQQEQAGNTLQLWGQSCFIRTALLVDCWGGCGKGRAMNSGARVVLPHGRSRLWDHVQTIVYWKSLIMPRKRTELKTLIPELETSIYYIEYFWNNLPSACFYTQSICPIAVHQQTFLPVADAEPDSLQAPTGLGSWKGIT